MPRDDLRGRRLGGFELIEPLGTGGFASVWRARQLRLGRDVAVKVLDPVLARNPDAARRFEREGRAAAALDHPAIVPVYEAGESDGVVYLAMRLVDGPTLAQQLATDGRPDRDRLLDVVEAVASALDHAHERGIIHRDVKPSNVLLEGDRVWLADFGIAALAADVGRYTSGALGTVAYMAPEQARPGDIDHRADLYALGCVAFECVTGSVPFPADDLVASLLAHASEPVPALDDPALDRFFARALAKAPEERFASGAKLAAELRTALAGRGEAHGAARRAPRAADADTLESTAPFTPVAAGGDHGPRDRRGRRRPRLVLAASLVAAVAVLAYAVTRIGDDGDGATAAPSVGEEDVEQLADGGTVVVGFRAGEVTSPNPHVDLDAEGLVAGNVLPPLYAVDADGRFVPHLAEGEPEVVAADPLQVRWRLRADAVWDDGTPIEAGDVERTYRYLVDPASRAQATGLYSRIAEFRIEDSRTFTITFNRPVGEPRLLFSTFHPVLQAASLDDWLATGGAPDQYLAAAIDYSGGPFLLAAFEAGREARLVRNEAWWGTPARLDRVVVRFADSGGGAVEGVVSGDYDVALVEVPQDGDRRRAADEDGLAVSLVPGTVQFGVQFNLADPVLADVRARRAILHALDRDGISGAVAGGGTGDVAAPPGSLVFFPGQVGYEDHLSATRDEAEAIRLLDEAGLVAGPDGQRITLELRYPTDGYERARLGQLAVLVEEYLSDVGITVVTEPITGGELAQAWATGDFQLTLSLALQAPDPIAAVERYSGLRCPSTVAGCSGDGGLNFWSYDNPTVTDLLERSDQTVDQDERLELLREADRLLALDLPAIPIAQPPALVVARDDLRGLQSATRAGPLSVLSTWAFTT